MELKAQMEPEDMDPEDQEVLILSGMMDFCPCGPFDDAMKFVRDILVEATKLHKADDKYIDTVSVMVPITDIAKNLNVPVGAVAVVVNVLDDRGFMEHGGSLNFGWLTKSGEGLLHKLLQVFPKENVNGHEGKENI